MGCDPEEKNIMAEVSILELELQNEKPTVNNPVEEVVIDNLLETRIENVIDFVAAYDEILSDAERNSKAPQSVISFMIDYIKQLRSKSL